MKLYTCYSDSHLSLFQDYFLRTFPWSDGFVLDARQIPQWVQDGGVYRAEGWCDMTDYKTECAIEACKKEETFLWSDVDVVFFGTIVKQLVDSLADYDIVGQFDGEAGLCAGFYVCRGGPKTLALFERVRAIKRQVDFGCDQPALNHVLDMVKWSYLPSTFWSYGQLQSGRWLGEEPVPFPKNLSMVHANWMVGTDLKAKFLTMALDRKTH